MNRELDGIYFIVERNGKTEPVCFTDLTLQEIEEVVGDRDARWWKSVALHLKGVINGLGDRFNIIGE